jgi:Arc/MetJ family transcription regulator
MRTTINVDEKLLSEALKVTGERDRGRVVNQALDEMVRRRKIDRLLASRGKLDLKDNWEEWEEVELAEELKRLELWNTDDNS